MYMCVFLDSSDIEVGEKIEGTFIKIGMHPTGNFHDGVI